MRHIIIFASLALAIGGAAARYSDQLIPGKASSPVMAANAAPASAENAKYRSVTLQRTGAHFDVQARINGRPVDFLIDTGASMVALRESDAARLGMRFSPSDYNVGIQTANGTGRAARVRLNRVEINGISVNDVDAFVMPDRALSTNLLGMTFLSRVKFTHDRGRLVLEQ
jgi:aspartyl protease family protein